MKITGATYLKARRTILKAIQYMYLYQEDLGDDAKKHLGEMKFVAELLKDMAYQKRGTHEMSYMGNPWTF